MDMPAQDEGAFFVATFFLDYFKDLPDSRQPGKVIYPLDEVLLLALLATLAGAEAFTDIARFGEKKLPLLRWFRPFRDGTPPHDRIGDIFATLDAERFQRCFVAWIASVTGIPAGVIAIDGKTVRGRVAKETTRLRSTWCRPLPPVSALCLARSRWRTSPMRSSQPLRY